MARPWGPSALAASFVPAQREEEADAPPSNPLLDAHGNPIGLGAYSQIVTPAWNWNWPHLRLIDDVLDRVQRGELTRVIIGMPPRHGKTEKTTVRQATYRLELTPELRVIVAAYNAKYAQKLSRKIRRVATGRIPLSIERNSAEDWETIMGGGVRAVGVGEGIAGLPGDLILVDDPIKSRKDAYSQAFREAVWEWYREDLYTRLEPRGAIVITMTRRHEDDLVGRILASDEGPEWTVINLPALAEADDPLGRPIGAALCPDRFDEEALARIKRTAGDTTFSSLYQQHPSPAQGLIFKSEHFRYYTTRDHPIIGVPTLPDVWNNHLQSWDMSFKDGKDSNPVSGTTWSRLGANVYLRDRDNGRKDFPASITAVDAMTTKWPLALLKLVEDKANGPAIIASMRSRVAGLVPVPVNGDKVSRAHAIMPMFEAGNVWFPHPAIAPWVDAYKQQLLQFPLGREDDDVDSTTQALWRFSQEIQGGVPYDDEPAAPSEAVRASRQQF